MLPTTRVSITAMHAAVPVVRLIRPGYETTLAGWRENPLQGLTGTAKRDKLIRLGLLASQRSLTPSLDMSDWWTEPMPISRRPSTGQTEAGASSQNDLATGTFLDKLAGRELLRGLVLGADFTTVLGQFAICRTDLHRWAFTEKAIALSTLTDELTKLRASLRPWVQLTLQQQRPTVDEVTLEQEAKRLCRDIIGSMDVWCPTHNMTERFHYLDARIVRVDWFEALGAIESAALEANPYQRAHALFVAEQAFVRSAQRTPAGDKRNLTEFVDQARSIEPARRTLQQRRDIDQAVAVVQKRWKVRNDYLDALIEIGHADRAIMEYRLWTRRASGEAAQSGEPKDEFFGMDSLPGSGNGHLNPLVSLGAKRLPGGQLLTEAAAHRRRGVTVQPDHTLDDLAARLSEAARNGLGLVEVQWSEMRALTIEVIRQLADSRGRKVDDSVPMLPVFDVVVAVGRGGALLATALCQVLGVRLMGTMAMSRYADSQTLKGTTPYLRGLELPVVNARRVLICDDVIKSGVTMATKAVPVVRSVYSDAEIHVAAYLGDDATMQAHQAPGGRENRAADQWYAGLTARLRQAKASHRAGWLAFRWAPIDIHE